MTLIIIISEKLQVPLFYYMHTLMANWDRLPLFSVGGTGAYKQETTVGSMIHP